MPKKTFVAGEVLTASDVNTFLMDQAVMSFAGTAARGSAIASPSEGMVSYLEDTDQVEVYGGTAVGWSSASNFLFGTAVPSDGQVVTYSTAVSGYVPADASVSGATNNFLYNGAMAVAQRGTSFTASANNDDVYTLDRWILLSDGNDAVDVTQSTDGPETFAYSIALDVETANKKFGILQILENKDSIALENQDVVLSFYAKTTGSSLSDVKAVVLSWNSTADSVTSDVVSAWNASGTIPTFAANWTAENTAVNLNVTGSWARYSVTATVDTASMANVAVFIWNDDDATTAGDFLYVTGVQLETGTVESAFQHKSYGADLAGCQRYYYRRGDSSTNEMVGFGLSAGSNFAYVGLDFPVQMRAAPTLGVTAANTFLYDDGSTIANPNAVGSDQMNRNSASISVVVTGLTASRGFRLLRDGTDACYAEFSAEL